MYLGISWSSCEDALHPCRSPSHLPPRRQAAPQLKQAYSEDDARRRAAEGARSVCAGRDREPVRAPTTWLWAKSRVQKVHVSKEVIT